MKALQYEVTGGPEVLRVVDVPEPHAGPGQVRVAVHAAGVNPYDWKLRSGLVQGKLPVIPGSEVAGVIDEVGPDVVGAAVGDEVFGSSGTAGAAQFALVRHFATKPAGMSFAEAAAVTVAAETSVRALDLLGAAPGDTLLINAAAGGVGSMAVQLATARGINVIGTASAANHDYLRELGAIPTTYGDGLRERVAELARGRVDYALDAGGRGALPDLVAITGSADRVVTIADYPGAEKTGVRFTGGGGGPRAWHALAEAAELYERGQLVLPVARTFSLDEAAEAHRISEAGHVRGKLVLLVDGA